MPSVRDLAVSVIIPVYNAESYLSKAVEAAEQHKVVKELMAISN